MYVQCLWDEKALIMFGLERMAPYSIFFIDVNDINLFP